VRSVGWFLRLSILVSSVLTAGISPVGAQQAAGPIDPHELQNWLDGFFPAQIEALHIPGIAFAVVQDGRVLFSKGYGLADVEDGSSFSADETIVQAGSVAKLLVATAVMQLVAEGRLDLQADVNSYLKDFRIDDDASGPITLAYLLTHTAGFDDFWQSSTDPAVLQPLGRYLVKHRPRRVMPAGEVMSYSNHGYDLAAFVVESVSGVPFHRYVSERIFQPLGMEHSSYLLSSDLPAGLATGYTFSDGVYRPQPVEYRSGYPSGELLTTAADMAKLMIALLEGGYGDVVLLQADVLAAMHQQQFTNHPDLPGWTYGFGEEYQNGQRILSHSGGARGFANDLVLLPEHRLGYFVSYNHEASGRAQRLLGLTQSAFMDRYFPAEPPGWPLLVNPTGPRRLVGRYRPNRYVRSTVYKIAVLDRELVASADDGVLQVGAFRYREVAPLVFQEVDGYRLIAFAEDERGEISHLFLGPSAYDRLAWYETGPFQRALFHVWGWLWGLHSAGLVLVYLVRRWRRRPASSSVLARAHILVVAMGVLNLAFLVSLDAFFWRSRATMTGMLLLPLVSIGLTAGLAIAVTLTWRRRTEPLATRAYLLLVVVLAVLFAAFLWSWNLVGFHFG
jgi:CubicO group peptidase (beta-lactamase class C family)